MDDLKREISLSFLKEGNVTSYLEFIKIAYYEYSRATKGKSNFEFCN